MKKAGQKIGLVTATSLVVGNMIGAGIFVLPATLASYGSVSIIGWILSALGALVLARIFANLSRIITNKSGGPYIYTKEGFGDFIAFLVAWGYWISIWVGNAGFVIAILSALGYLFPVLQENKIYAVSLGLAFIWILSWVNSRGVKSSGRIQVFTTVFKLLPLVFIILIGGFFFKIENFPAFNLTDNSDMVTIPVVATLTLYAFLGMESATIPAENVKDPEKTIPQATILGTVITTLVYILGTVVLFGILPAQVLQDSASPFAAAAEAMGGEYAGYFVAVGAAVSAIGALNGWILISGQIPMASAKDQLFPRIFQRENKKGAPGIGIFIGSTLTSLVMLMNFSDKLADQFEFVVLLTTLSALIPYLFTTASYALIIVENKFNLHKRVRQMVLASLGFSFAFWSVLGAGDATVFYGFLLLLLGIPFYVLMAYNKKRRNE